uniref:Uncharacterized protein n=1 Tax=viral metagenome TaxID=1070528 RepID=A0A6H1ZLF2_9ZZZZ
MTTGLDVERVGGKFATLVYPGGFKYKYDFWLFAQAAYFHLLGALEDHIEKTSEVECFERDDDTVIRIFLKDGFEQFIQKRGNGFNFPFKGATQEVLEDCVRIAMAWAVNTISQFGVTFACHKENEDIVLTMEVG